MSLMARNFLAMAFAAFACTAPLSVAQAQTSGTGCALDQVAGTSRQILRCQQGLTIVVEPGARYTLVDRDGDGNADSARLRSKALLIEGPGRAAGTRFQVITPQAIAAVRGTKWAIDVQAGGTSVLVLNGRVAVQRSAASAGVVLGPGQGVDVDDGSGPLTVRRWPPQRVSALLARLGQ